MVSNNLAFEIIENNGPDNLRDTLYSKLAQASEVCIAVAFLTQSGLYDIIQPLRQVATKGKIRLITGLYQYITEPAALEMMLNIQTETRGNFSVRLSKEPKFHRKFYLLESKTKATAIIGSSNLTRDGLQSGGELNLMLSLSKTSPSMKKLKRAFEKEWELRSVPLVAKQIIKYTQTRPKSKQSQSYKKGQLKSILGAEPSHQKASTSPVTPFNFWRDCITGLADKRTIHIISETTNWDGRYYWFSTGRKHMYQMHDRIFLFDETDNYLRLVEVKDIAHTKVPTPNGRNFIAYKFISGYQKRISETLWEKLKNENIRKKDIYNVKKLTKENAKRLSYIIKVSHI